MVFYVIELMCKNKQRSNRQKSNKQFNGRAQIVDLATEKQMGNFEILYALKCSLH
jgi:hypothetical protein